MDLGIPNPIDVEIRPFAPEDQQACVQLYEAGLLGGKLADNDTGADIDDIASAYDPAGGSMFWVAQLPQPPRAVIAMIGVQQYEKGVGEIRRLRVHRDYRGRGVGTRLLMTALEFCRDHQILKVTLDTWIDREHALKLFEKYNFVHQRTREAAGKQMLTFYLDIYGNEREEEP